MSICKVIHCHRKNFICLLRKKINSIVLCHRSAKCSKRDDEMVARWAVAMELGTVPLRALIRAILWNRSLSHLTRAPKAEVRVAKVIQPITPRRPALHHRMGYVTLKLRRWWSQQILGRVTEPLPWIESVPESLQLRHTLIIIIHQQCPVLIAPRAIPVVVVVSLIIRDSNTSRTRAIHHLHLRMWKTVTMTTLLHCRPQQSIPIMLKSWRNARVLWRTNWSGQPFPHLMTILPVLAEEVVSAQYRNPPRQPREPSPVLRQGLIVNHRRQWYQNYAFMTNYFLYHITHHACFLLFIRSTQWTQSERNFSRKNFSVSMTLAIFHSNRAWQFFLWKRTNHSM